MEKCFECEKEAKWVRVTQFSGEHFFCKKHAKAEEDFKQADSYFFWTKVKKCAADNTKA